MASQMTTIQVRVDKKLKSQANEVLAQLHINMSEAIKMFLAQIVHQRGVPLEMRIPNENILKRIEEGEKGVGMHEASSVDDLFEELDR